MTRPMPALGGIVASFALTRGPFTNTFETLMGPQMTQRKFPVKFNGVELELNSVEDAAALVRELVRAQEADSAAYSPPEAEHGHILPLQACQTSPEDAPTSKVDEKKVETLNGARQWTQAEVKKFMDSLWPSSRTAMMRMGTSPKGQ